MCLLCSELSQELTADSQNMPNSRAAGGIGLGKIVPLGHVSLKFMVILQHWHLNAYMLL